MKSIVFESEEDKFIVSRWLYSISEEPPLTDFEYNFFLRKFLEEGKLEEYTSRTCSHDHCPLDLLLKYGLERFRYDVLIGDKSESIPSIIDESLVKQRYENAEGPFVIGFKEDGINLQKTYYNGALVKYETRGRFTDPIDLTFLIEIDKVQRIPIMGEVKILGEGQLSNDNFEKLKKISPEKELKSQRASVKSALSRKETAYLVDFHAFNIVLPDRVLKATDIYHKLETWGFTTPYYIVVEKGNQVIEAVKTLSENLSVYGFKTDGAVVRSNVGGDLIAVRIFAWAEEIYYSYVTGLEETPSDMYYGCKLLIFPCDTGQSTQKRINITNIKLVQQHSLFKGSPIAFTLRSDAIADIDAKTTRELQNAWQFNPQGYMDYIKDKEEIKRRKLQIGG